MGYSIITEDPLVTVSTATVYLGGSSSSDRTARIKKQRYVTTYAVGAITAYLPDAIPGLHYRIEQQSVQPISLTVSGTDTFSGSLVGTNIWTSNQLGAHVDLVCVEAGKWIYQANKYNVSLLPASVSTSGTGEDNLMTFAIPPIHHKINLATRLEGGGTITGTAGNHTIKLYVGSVNGTIIQPTTSDGVWSVSLALLHYSWTETRVIWSALIQSGVSAATAHTGYIVCPDNVNSGLACKFTGECANAADTITQTMCYAVATSGVAAFFP